MELLQPLVLIMHIVGVAMGVGGAITTDATFLRSIWDRTITKGQLQIIEIISKVVVSGLVLLILSGISLVAINPHYLSLTDGSQLFWVKMTIVFILTMNGVAFHKKILPILQRHADKSLASDEVRSKLWLLALTGGLSGISWVTVLALGKFMQVTDFSYLLIMNGYLLLVLGAVLTGYIGIYWVLFSDLRGKPLITSNSNELPKKPKIPWLNRALMGLTIVAALVIGIWYVNTQTETARGEDHFVCIHEGPPWFTPEVLEIEKGDTVVWHHCSEDEVDYVKEHGSKQGFAFFNNKVSAHSDDQDNGEHNTVHTHPIYSISGPEHFSSDFGVVGHLDEGLEFRHTFSEAGVYEYICPTHPYMKGMIAVGEEAPVDSLWPPDEGYDEADLLGAPDIPGVGEIWLNTQFEHIDGQEFPGSITVLDAETWEIKEVITDEYFNNPHNLWNTYDDRYVFQTQWHSDKVSKIDIQTKEVVDTVTLGNAPAHLFVHPTKDRIYVTLNNEAKIVVLDRDLNQLNEIETSFGPHGVWIDPSGRWLSSAATLEQKLDIIDLETEEVVKTFDAPGLPLATQITNDGRYAMISLLLEGKVRFIDLETLEHVTDVEVGSMPIWAMPGPYGDRVFVPNTGSGDISVISLDTLEVETTLPGAAGAHGITFGEKQDGGYYGYVSNKYARVVTVIDVDELETLGHIPLRESAWGGNGILTLPNYYAEYITR